MKYLRPIVAVLLALPLSSTARAAAPSAAPKLDLRQFIGSWYEITRYPSKRERHCTANQLVLYTLGDKHNSFQMVTSCQVKTDNADAWNASGKAPANAGGKLRLTRFLFFSTPYWVFAVGPEYNWALVGTPNHKSLAVLSRSPTLPPATLREIEAVATTHGFDIARLKATQQTGQETP